MERAGGGQPVGELADGAAGDRVAPVCGNFGQRGEDEAAAGQLAMRNAQPAWRGESRMARKAAARP